jgi:hypothetical protein
VARNHFCLISSGAGQPCRSAFRPISRPTQPNHHRPLPLAFARAAIGRAPPFHVPLTGRLCSSQRTIVSSSPLPLWTTGEPPLRFPSLNQHHVDSPPFLQCQKPMKLIPTAGCPPPTPPPHSSRWIIKWRCYPATFHQRLNASSNSTSPCFMSLRTKLHSALPPFIIVGPSPTPHRLVKPW